MIHLLNLLYPNLFETSPHVIDRIIEAIDAIRMAVGVGQLMNYIAAGLFHPARRVRVPYWRLWNDAYVAGGDGMVPYFVDLEGVGVGAGFEAAGGSMSAVVNGNAGRWELGIVL